MTKALHDFVKRAWLASVSTQHAQYRFMVSHKSIFFVSDVFVFYDFLCFFFVCFFFPSAGRDDRPLYCTVPCNEAWQFDVWMMCLDCGFKCFGAFFKFLPKLPSSEKSQNERTLV